MQHDNNKHRSAKDLSKGQKVGSVVIEDVVMLAVRRAATAASAKPNAAAPPARLLLAVQRDVSDELGLRSSLGGAQDGSGGGLCGRIPGTALIVLHNLTLLRRLHPVCFISNTLISTIVRFVEIIRYRD